MKKGKATLNDVANTAGVSPATVSRVLNHRSIVKPDTLRQVENAMQTLGYTPKGCEPEPYDNGSLIVLNIPSSNSLFYHEITHGAFECAKANDYYLIINEYTLTEASAAEYCNLLRRVKAAGVIMLNSVSEQFLSTIQEVCPVIQCCEYNDQTAFSYVSIDDYRSAWDATNHLISCGCDKIAMLNGPSCYNYAIRRRAGFLDALNTAGIAIPENWNASIADINYDMAFSACYRLLSFDNAPKAFFAVSDVFAIAAVNAAKQFHLRVPEDVMVVGFDNLDISRMTSPAITTVNQPRTQMGYTAFELLQDRIQNPADTPKSVILNTELIVRSTTMRSTQPETNQKI